MHVSDTNAVLIDYLPSSSLNEPQAIYLPAGASNLTADFAYYREGQQMSALGDFVWYDANRNGVQDVDEPGLGNVVLDFCRIQMIVAD